MNLKIDIAKSPIHTLPALTDDEAKDYAAGKGWSFFNVYFLPELRDVFLLLRNNNHLGSQRFAALVHENIIPVKTEWNERRVLEHVNALQNLGLLNQERIILRDNFDQSEINSPLSELDKDVFRNLFFSYFRFKEIMKWFLEPQHHRSENKLQKPFKCAIIEDSKPLFYFSRGTRFTDTFFYDMKENNPDLYCIPEDMEHLKRFWDVFLKWGQTLGVLDKFSLTNFDVSLSSQDEVNCCYFLRTEEIDIDFLAFLRSEFDSRYIFIPDLILKLVLKLRLSIDLLRDYVLQQIQSDTDYLTYERTSEIFIAPGRSAKSSSEFVRFYPVLNDSYISHVIIR